MKPAVCSRRVSADWGSAGAIPGPPHMKSFEEVNGCQPLGECGGHFWAPAYEELEEVNGCQPLGECGGHFWAPAYGELEELND